MSLTLIDPKARRILEKFNLNVQDVIQGEKEDFQKRIIYKFSGFDHQAVLKASQKLTEDYLSEVDKLGLDAKKVRRTLEQSVKEMVGIRRAEAKKSNASILEKIDYLFNSLHPRGGKQERIFNVFYYMNLFGGTEFIHWLLDHYDSNLSVLEIKNET